VAAIAIKKEVCNSSQIRAAFKLTKAIMNNFSKANLSSLIEKLKHNKTENKPVFFVGSAVSMFPPANLPSGGDTAGLVKKKLQRHSPCYRCCSKRLDSVWKDITFEGILELYTEPSSIGERLSRSAVTGLGREH
jgi:hypothetical protein